MIFRFNVSVEVERSQGKFASRDEIGELVLEALEQANPEQIEGENGGQFDITMWDITIEEPK
jgi:hypothetical protein